MYVLTHAQPNTSGPLVTKMRVYPRFDLFKFVEPRCLQLARQASRVASMRNHHLKQWRYTTTNTIGCKVYSTNCFDCDCNATIVFAPAANETQVSGDALVVNCNATN